MFFAKSATVTAYLGHIAGTSEAEGHRPNGLGHETHGDLVPTIPYCLDGLADVPVVMSHSDVLRTGSKRQHRKS